MSECILNVVVAFCKDVGVGDGVTVVVSVSAGVFDGIVVGVVEGTGVGDGVAVGMFPSVKLQPTKSKNMIIAKHSTALFFIFP